MAKKILKFTLVFIFLTSLAIWSPWEWFNFNYKTIFGVEEVDKYAGIELYSLTGDLELFIDDQSIGSVKPEDTVLQKLDIKPGQHLIVLNRNTNPPDIYNKLSKSINFIEGVNVVIAYELGPTSEFSQGHIFYAREASTKVRDGTAKLNITSEVTSVKVFLDGKEVGVTPIVDYDLPLDKVYSIKLQKDGYEDLEFQILPEGENDRKKLEGLDLFIDASLFQIPISIENNAK